MELLVPVQTSKDMQQMILHGIKEFYCGYLTNEWVDTFNIKHGNYSSSVQISINRRDSLSANVQNERELECMARIAKENFCKLFVTINAPFYPKDAYNLLDKYIKFLLKIGVEHIIVSDIGLMEYICFRYPSLLITISCENQVLNNYAVDFYNQFNPERIVFPRHMSIKEMDSVMRKNKNIEFEYFILSNKCIYDDGNCRCLHDLGAICTDSWRKQYKGEGGSSADLAKIKLAENNFEEWSFNFDSEVNEDMIFWKEFGCSICSLYNMVQYLNMASLKIVGRGKWIYYEDIIFIVDALKMAKEGATIEQLQTFAKRKYGFKDMCNTGRYCILRGEN